MGRKAPFFETNRQYGTSKQSRPFSSSTLVQSSRIAYRCDRGCSVRNSADMSGTPTVECRPFPYGRFFIARHAGPPLVGTQMRIFPTQFGPAPFEPSVSFLNGDTDAPTVPVETRCNKHFYFYLLFTVLFPLSLSGDNYPGVQLPLKENDKLLCA